MNDIKYEPVFGDQAFFDGAPEDAVYVRYGRDTFIFNSEINCHVGSLRDIPVVAARRIIKTPVWTKADQLAGKLPEVGAEVMCMDDSLHEFVGESIHESLRERKTGKIFHIQKSSVKPIETDTERQQRLREEWCSKALDSAGILSEMKCYELKRLGEYIGSIHDALLSGELKMPEVKK